MERIIKPYAIVLQFYCALMLGLAWVAVARTSFAPLYLSYLVPASLAMVALVASAWKKKLWLIVGCALFTILFTPSPLGLIPMIIGIALAVGFAVCGHLVMSWRKELW